MESRVKLMLVCLSPWLNHFKIVSSLIHLCFITLHFTSSLCVSLQNKITLFLHNHNYSFSKAVPAPAVCQIFLLICARSSMWIWPPPTLVSFPPSSQFTDLHVHTELFFSPYYRPCCIIGLCSLTSHPSSSTIMSVSKLSNLLHTGWKFLKSGADQTDRSSVEHPRFRFLFCFVYGPSNFWCGLYQQFTKILIKTLVGKDVVAVQLLSPVRLCDPWTAAHQASLSLTISQSVLKFTSIELVMPSNHLILCRPPLLLPSIFPSIRVFSNELALCINGRSMKIQQIPKADRHLLLESGHKPPHVVRQSSTREKTEWVLMDTEEMERPQDNVRTTGGSRAVPTTMCSDSPVIQKQQEAGRKPRWHSCRLRCPWSIPS